MCRENKGNILLFLGMALLLSGFVRSGISPRLQQKLDEAIETTYEVGDFELLWMEVKPELDARAPSEFKGEHLFRISSGTQVMGYGYLGEAKSMKEVYDYVVFFSPEFEIRKAKVLIYREEHGRQIGSQRWLKQFIGMGLQDTPEYGKNIDAISGATISASSMTEAVAAVLLSMQLVKQELVQ